MNGKKSILNLIDGGISDSLEHRCNRYYNIMYGKIYFKLNEQLTDNIFSNIGMSVERRLFFDLANENTKTN
jgi:hypothetical protein